MPSQTVVLPQVNGIFVTHCICFPRSGHTWTTKVLYSYFGDDFQHCEMYCDPGRIIAADPTTNFQKNHDLSLQQTIDPSFHYLIQARNPENAILSWYLAAALGKDGNTGSLDLPREDRASRILTEHIPAYLKWRADKMAYWEGFRIKWIFSAVPNSMIMYYEKTLADPVGEFSKVIQFLTGSRYFDERRLEVAIRVNPKP